MSTSVQLEQERVDWHGNKLPSALTLKIPGVNSGAAIKLKEMVLVA